MLSNVAGCRQVFERWMEWEPDEQAWHSYINFELRYQEVDRARSIYEKYILFHHLSYNCSIYFSSESGLYPIRPGQSDFLEIVKVIF